MESRHDLTDLRRAEVRMRFTNDLLALFVEKTSLKEYLDAVAKLLHEWSGCRSLGIRLLDEQQRIPYVAHVGFSKEFLELEGTLSLMDDHCCCTRVVRGKPEPQDLPLLTPGGSFRTDNAQEFEKMLNAKERERFRLNCVVAGFASIAVVPIRYRDQIIGAVHVTDERPGKVPPEKVEFIESMTPLIGEAVHRFNVEEQIRRLNEELERRVQERTAQLQAANEELASFAYSVSHDLRAPLRAIHGYTGMILEGYAQALGEEGRRLFEVVRANAQRMSDLIDALLTLSRMGRKEMDIQPIQMDELARQTFREAQAQVSNRTIKCQFQKLPPAYGDVTMIRQVLANLFSNALKFTRTKPEAYIEVGAREEGREVVYYVRDNGVGFDMEYANKLFGAFQRLHREDEFEGIGIGLSLVQRIIHRHGGRVWAEGKVGEGATFYFTLPKVPTLRT